MLVDAGTKIIRSQKVLGIRMLTEGFYGTPALKALFPKNVGGPGPASYVFLVQSNYDLDEWIEQYAKDWFETFGELFFRPCPPSPQHGFIDSESYAGSLDWEAKVRAKWEATKEADPLSEMLIMPFIDAKYSGIYVDNGHFTIGKGYDGVTGGKGGTSLRLAPINVPSKLKQDARIYGENDHAFFEFVTDGNYSTHLVQARGGPSVPFSADYIPQDVKVESVCAADINMPLPDWKEYVEKHLCTELTTGELIGRQGVVVYCPGAPITSHIAIHCVSHGIPFFSTFKPEEGGFYAKAVEGVPFDAKAFREGASAAFARFSKSNYYEFCNFLNACFFMMRNIPHLIQSPGREGWRVAGYALEGIALGGGLAVIGESRRSEAAVMKTSHIADRTECYEQWMGRAPEFWNRVGLAGFMLNHETHKGGGIGGPKWVRAAISALKVHNRVIEWTEKGFKAALDEANTLVDLAHNNGWLLNKFTSKQILDSANLSPHHIIAYQGRLLDALYSEAPLLEKREYRAAERRYRLEREAGSFRLAFIIPELGDRTMRWMSLTDNKKNLKMVKDLLEEA
jgi:hypothetical protein